MNIKPIGTSILFINDNGEVLLFLRDNKTSIPYPNHWDILGGHLEGNETPEQCIIREMKEELEIDIMPKLFKVTDMTDRVEYTFWQKVNFRLVNMKLNEGQKLQWFSEDDIKNLPEDKIAFDFKPIILEFFNNKPFVN
jgi:8-oxo-dGTP diphosphatase